MRIGIANLSDIVREDRMDAGFHLAAQEHSDAVVKLRATLSEDAARDLVLGLPDSVLTKRVDGTPVLGCLVRGSAHGTTLRQLRGVVSEYPHLSLALLSGHLDAAVASAEDEIEDIRRSIAAIRDVASVGASKEPS